jgi:hypothetical protein
LRLACRVLARLALPGLLGCIGADVLFAAFTRKPYLFLAFSETPPRRVALVVVTGRTAYAGLVFVAGLFGVGDGPPAGMTLVIAAFFERVVNAYAIIEDKTLTVP